MKDYPVKNYKLIVGFITYSDLTAKYLPDFLGSLKKQDYPDFKIIAIDNSETEDNDNARLLKNNHPEIDFVWAGTNIGFARAYNKLIESAIGAGAEYFLALNPDTALTENFLSETLKAIEGDKTIGAVAPKILKWDFANNKKTAVIDSCGLSINREHRFSDIGQGERDGGSADPREVFGFTGAAAIFRIAALEDIAFKKAGDREFFDELMFMYKEDCDLSYRLRLAGWKIIFCPKAVIYHDRTASPQGESNLKIALNRRNKSQLVKKWSFLNHSILLLKYKNLPFSFAVRWRTAWYQLKSLVFILLFEQFLLTELMKLWKMRTEIGNKRGQLKIRADIAEIERFMT